ncbi:MAG: hypothetical protein IH598_04545 [Bacteroidales bacterium]|nr:hypothetical protein [Bacteroidales bacterium]
MKKHLILNLMLVVALMLSFQNEAFPQRKKDKVQPPEMITTNLDGAGLEITLEATPGKSHNHPMMAVWVEDSGGKYIQTLYVNESVAKGYFNYADKSEGKWKPGELVRPASLPVWAHKRGVKSDAGHYMPTQSNPIPDAYTSATPEAGFVLQSKTDKSVAGKFKVLFEINQSWDWNEYWTNSKFPDDDEYKTSAQPSVVYAVDIDPEKLQESYELKPVGHGHHSGKDGNINPDLSTITTALQIVEIITVKVSRKK